MRDAVGLFGAFGVVKALERADEVPRDAPDALEGDGVEVVGDVYILAVVAAERNVDVLMYLFGNFFCARAMYASISSEGACRPVR